MRRDLDALTHGPVREQVRLARPAGDREALAEWTERLVVLKDGRAERLGALPATLVAGLRALFVMVCVLTGLLIMAGVWLALTPDSIGWWGWWSLIRHLLDGALTTLSFTVRWCGADYLRYSWRVAGGPPGSAAATVADLAG